MLLNKNFIVLLTLSFFINIHQSCFGQIKEDSLKKAVVENLLFDFWGDFIPDNLIKDYQVFFDCLLDKKNLSISDIDLIKMFPTGVTEEVGGIEFKYCVINFITKMENERSYHFIFVLDENLNFIDFMKVISEKLINGVPIIISSVSESKENVFRLNYYLDNQEPNSPPNLDYSEYYFISKNRIVLK